MDRGGSRGKHGDAAPVTAGGVAAEVVQFSLTEEEFDQVSAAAAQSGMARGAFAAGSGSRWADQGIVAI
jgi:hypothetical protein